MDLTFHVNVHVFSVDYKENIYYPVSSRQNGDEDSYLTAASGQDSGGDVSEDFNTSNSPNESDPSDSSQNVIRNIDEGTEIFYSNFFMSCFYYCINQTKI